MPAAAISAAAAVGGALISSSAAKKAAGAVQDGADQAAQVQLQIYQDQVARQEPWRQVGLGALGTLGRTMGLIPSGGSIGGLIPSGATNPASGMSGGDAAILANGLASGAAAPGQQQISTPGISSGAAYFAANPDVQAEYDDESTRDKKSKAYLKSLGINSAEDFAQWHYKTFGEKEGRACPAATAPVYAAPAQAPPPSVSAGPGATDYSGKPLGPNGVPGGLVAGTNARYGEFYASPDYAFRFDEGNRALTGNYAAKGLLESGAFAKGLIGYGQAAASQEFGSWFNRIASLAGVGQTATAQVGQAGQNYANQTGLIRQSAGMNQGSSILGQGSALGYAAGQLGQIGAGLIQNRGGGAAPTLPGSPQMQTVFNPQAQQAWNPQGLVPTSSLTGAVI